jgi:hypothetical protein
MTDDDLFVAPPEDLVREPRHRVVARLSGPDEAAAAIRAMQDAGISNDEVYVLCGEAGARRLDPTGKHHGLKGRLVRAVETIASEGGRIQEDADHLAAGGVLMSAPARDDHERHVVQQALRANGATRMRYYGAATFEDVGGGE